jgi:hypothetical protein
MLGKEQRSVALSLSSEGCIGSSMQLGDKVRLRWKSFPIWKPGFEPLLLIVPRNFIDARSDFA